MFDLIDQCRDLVARHCAGTGRWVTPVSGLARTRCDAPTAPARTVYNPRLCVVLQGGKEIAVGTRLLRLDAGTRLVATVVTPVTASVRGAASTIRISSASRSILDRRAIADMLIGLAAGAVRASARRIMPPEPWRMRWSSRSGGSCGWSSSSGTSRCSRR